MVGYRPWKARTPRYPWTVSSCPAEWRPALGRSPSEMPGCTKTPVSMAADR